MMLKDTVRKKIKLFTPIYFVPFVIIITMVLAFILELGMDWDFTNGGVYPRQKQWIWTIFTSVFIHKDFSHLINNLISFTVLSGMLFYFYRSVNVRIFFALWIFSGVLLWIIGRESRHIGASSLVYAMASFLFFSGIIRKHIPLIAISLIVTVLYGTLIWYIFPCKIHEQISWEGHLSGLVAGLIIAVISRKYGPQKPVKIWAEEDEEDNENDYWKIADEPTDKNTANN